MADTPAHDQSITNKYVIHYPEHPERKSDPHYKDFNAYRRQTKKTAQCAFAVEIGDFTDCRGGIELHHSHVEFSLQNGINLKHLEHVYPGVSDPNTVGAWVESGTNFMWLCARHHREAGAGIHHLAAADFEASKFVDGLTKDA